MPLRRLTIGGFIEEKACRLPECRVASCHEIAIESSDKVRLSTCSIFGGNVCQDQDKEELTEFCVFSAVLDLLK